MHLTVNDFLGRSPNTLVKARLELGAGRMIAVWENRNDRISYNDPQGHTFSLYLRGGTGTRRLDKGISGRPGAVCIIPEGHRSDWEIAAPFRFVHLYVSDKAVRATYAHIHDCDARRLELRDHTFIEAPAIASPLAKMAHSATLGDLVLADEAFAELIAHLPERRPFLAGGLSQYYLHRLDEWIDAHLDHPMRLSDLAAITGLSVFHFHRMFRLSRSMAPSEWITARRTETAKKMLRTSIPIAEISAACGFANQSHLTRIFKARTGMTPGKYRILTSR